MSQPQQRQRTGQRPEPKDELDVANEFVSSPAYDDLLNELNLGTGYYESEDHSMQMRSFRSGMVAFIAFDGILWHHAIQETKIRLADEGFRFHDAATDKVHSWKPVDEVAGPENPFDDDERYQASRARKLRERGEEIWSKMSDPEMALSDKQAAAMSEKVGYDSFKPVFWRLVAAYHETSKSRGGRMQDNFFNRVKEHIVPDSKSGLLGGSS